MEKLPTTSFQYVDENAPIGTQFYQIRVDSPTECIVNGIALNESKSNIGWITITNIEEILVEKINIYPNPGRNSIFLNWDGKQDIVQIKVHNLMGKLIIQKEWKGSQVFKLDVSNLNIGPYILSLNSASKGLISKIILVR